MDAADIDWLKERRVLSKSQFVLTTYVGHGLCSHIDINFEGPVFVITVMIEENEKVKDKGDPKYISVGMKGRYLFNQHSCVENNERQVYFFYGWMTDWAYHGVPALPGWKSIVFIIRQGRVTKIKR